MIIAGACVGTSCYVSGLIPGRYHANLIPGTCEVSSIMAGCEVSGIMVGCKVSSIIAGCEVSGIMAGYEVSSTTRPLSSYPSLLLSLPLDLILVSYYYCNFTARD
uniref:Uncharacterized protein n=1 Tax=Oryza nivara TaxID=4536 RepID=A0A0E0IVL6_ORYNI